MPWSLLDILISLPIFMLVLMRISGLMITAPVFASTMIPIRIRVAFVFVLSAMLFPVISKFAPQDMTIATALVGAFSELMIGIGIGLSISIFMMGAEVAGRMIAQQAGLGIGQVIDPTQNTQTSIVGQVYTISLTMLFLMVGGHRATVAALVDTYQIIPICSYQMDDTFVLLLIEMLTSAFMFGIRIAGPVVIALFLTGVSLGVISRTMPQLNILTVGFTLRALIALAVAGISLSACQEIFLDGIWDTFEVVRATFGLDPAQTRLTM